MKFPKKFDMKVKSTHFKLDALKPWIAKRITELMEMEGDDCARTKHKNEHDVN